MIEDEINVIIAIESSNEREESKERNTAMMATMSLSVKTNMLSALKIISNRLKFTVSSPQMCLLHLLITANNSQGTAIPVMAQLSKDLPEIAEINPYRLKRICPVVICNDDLYLNMKTLHWSLIPQLPQQNN